MKCDHCPLTGQSRACLAETTGHRRFCTLTDPTSPDYRPAYIDLILGDRAAPDAGAPTQDPDEAARLRRASKPRIALGARQGKG